MALLEIKNLSFTYGGAIAPALNNINLSVESGDLVIICGESGCGKTTLLKLIKKQLRPEGTLEGEILFRGQNTDDIDERTMATEIGYVMQNPERSIVTDKVWHELAFGPESLGEKTDVIRRKVAEICGFFGMSDIYRKKTCELSGGQKQLLALASVMTCEPSLLILDEPTSQLDPIAASTFLSSIRKINEELGVTVIISEHNLEEVFPMASKVVVMEKAGVMMCAEPRLIGQSLPKNETGEKIGMGLPCAVRIFHSLSGSGECPITVKDGKKFISENYKTDITRLNEPKKDEKTLRKALEVRGGYFRYEPNSPDVLSGLELCVFENEIFCILGANGAGKTTLMRVLSGVRSLYKGKYLLFGEKAKKSAKRTLAAMPQDPADLFVMNTLFEDLAETVKFLSVTKKEGEKKVNKTAEKLGISGLLGSHPYDLSGGEQQKAALAKLLLMEPEIILLDEPTKGLDAYSKKELALILSSLKSEGKTIVIVTHDVEFAAEYADRCAMFFDGGIVCTAPSTEFFASNRYYTTAAARITRPMYENAVTAEAAVKLCRLNGKREKT